MIKIIPSDVQTYIHFFLDWRDVPPQSAAEYMKDFDGELNGYYDINKWMPHCTISIRLSDEELFKGIELLKELLIHIYKNIVSWSVIPIGILSYSTNITSSSPKDGTLPVWSLLCNILIHFIYFFF